MREERIFHTPAGVFYAARKLLLPILLMSHIVKNSDAKL